MARDTSLLDKDLLVVTGKGGVGKSTVAAAIGTVAAASGRRTIIAEVSARDDISRALAGSSTEPFVERSIGDGLHHISIDPQRAMEEYLADQLPSRTLAELLGSSRAFTYLAAATPGLRELLTIGKVWELAQKDRRTPGAEPYDLVVLDAPATGHGVAVLSAPTTFSEAARVGPIARQGGKIAAMLRNPRRTAVIGVATGEEMPVNETLSLGAAIHASIGLRLSLVVVNAVLADRFTSAEAEQLTLSGGAAVDAALSEHARARAQRAQIARLRRGLTGVPVRTLPLVVRAELRPADVVLLGRKLGLE